ncbi:hypothetical protein EJB05_14970, partial [Eragrostis curvula]
GLKGDISREISNMGNSQNSSAFPREPSLQLLKQITNDFSSERLVGCGGFGKVYKGIHESGQLIAVKRLERTLAVHDRRFQNEVSNLMMLEHRNVESKLNDKNNKHIFSHASERFLCYEYLSRGSLDEYIDEYSGLDWHMRFKIITGVCNGLHFLHEERNEAMVHLNLKPSNILLDDNMVPKITDFGLSRLFGEEQTRVFTKNVVRKKWIEKMYAESKYPSLEEEYLQQVKRCIELGLNCVETNPKKRPTAALVMDKLKVKIVFLLCPLSMHELVRKNLQTGIAFPREPKLQFLKDITMNFSNERIIGKGSFGAVYKGVLRNGEVAIKRILAGSSTDQDKQFINEVTSLMDLNHRNIVSLIGYCYEIQRKLAKSQDARCFFMDTAERLLCYEYLPRGSLDNYLYGASHEIDWNLRFNIIQGICQGLQFLHELQRPIVHMDLKPGNILLDDNLIPKIADFGLSRLFGEEQTRTITLHARENWTKVPQIAYRYPSLTENSLQQVKVCIEIALNCVRKNPRERPSVGKIIDWLNGKELLQLTA